MQLNMPSDVQGPDLADEPPPEPVELPAPEPPPVGERVADGAGFVVGEAEEVAEASAEPDEAVDEAESLAVGAVIEPESVADPEVSEAEVADATGAGVTGLT